MQDRCMIESAHTHGRPAPSDRLPHSTPEDVREWLGILTLSTTILQTHGSRLPQSERRTHGR